MSTLAVMLPPKAGIDFSVASCCAGAFGERSRQNLQCDVAQLYIALLDVV